MMDLKFSRAGNGSVRVESPYGETVIPLDHWCSIIAQMSYYGEEDYGFYRAQEFHTKVPVRETCPLKDKPVPSDW